MAEWSKVGYFLKEFDLTDPKHGGIGNKDAEKIMERMGLRSISFPCKSSRSFNAKLSRLSYLIKIIFSIPANSLVIFQFPLYSGMSMLLLRALARKKSTRLICFIADIDGLKDDDKKTLEKEKRMYALFHGFVVHNKAMREWIAAINPKAYAAEIEFFDFLTEPVSKERKMSNTIVFAGNLAKSRFINELHLVAEKTKLSFILYGEGLDKKVSGPGIDYKGVEDPNVLPQKIEASFGLVWEGDSIYDTTGKLGKYVRYISNHKLSLYILCGLPVIVPVHAGSAGLVNKYGIGFAVSNLFEIEEKIEGLSNEEYRNMAGNMRALAAKISNGDCLRNALNELAGKL